MPNAALWTGLLGLALALFGFSMSGVWVRWLVALDPLALTGWRVLIALGLLVPAALSTGSGRAEIRSFLRHGPTHLTALLMTGFFVIAVIGFQQAPVALVLLCLGLSPAWVLLIERLRGQAIAARQALGVGVALLGTVVGLAPAAQAWLSDEGGDANGAALGALCGLIAGVLSAAYTVARKRLRSPAGQSPSAVFLAGLTSFWGLVCFPLGAMVQAGQLAPVTTGEVGAVLGFGILSTAAPLWGFSAASRSLAPLWVALTTPMVPFGGALAAWLLLAQVPSAAFFVGAPLVLAGIALVLTARR